MKIIYALAFIAGLIYSGKAFVDYLDLPYIFVSVDTKKCAFIELADGNKISCDYFDRNQKYIQLWSGCNDND